MKTFQTIYKAVELLFWLALCRLHCDAFEPISVLTKSSSATGRIIHELSFEPKLVNLRSYLDLPRNKIALCAHHNRRMFLERTLSGSAGVAITCTTALLPASAWAAVDDLAMPTVAEQKKLEDVRSDIVVISRTILPLQPSPPPLFDSFHRMTCSFDFVYIGICCLNFQTGGN
jgi:hypothetical protein